MKGVHHTTSDSNKQYEIYAEDDRRGRLERGALEVYRLYQQDTPLRSRLLTQYPPELHNTIKWICTCLEHVDEFRNSELLDEVKKNHKSLRVALNRIDKMAAPDLKSKAVKFAAQNAQPGCQGVECRYDPRQGHFFAGIQLDKMHEVDVGSGKDGLWAPVFLARGLRAFTPFYDCLENLERLGKLVKPQVFTRDTPTREGCLKAEKPLEVVQSEVKYNHAVSAYNAALTREQHAVFAATGGGEIKEGAVVHPWLSKVTATRLLEPHLLKIMVMDGFRLKVAYEDPRFHDVVKGCKTLNASPEPYSDVLYKYTAAGLDVPIPEEDFLEQLRADVNAPEASPQVCKEKFASTYIIARNAVEHYRNQTRLINDDILKSSFTAHSAQALHQRLKLVGQYYDHALKVLMELRHAIRLPVTDDDRRDISEIKALYLEFGHGNLKKAVPGLTREALTLCAPDVFGMDTWTVSVKQSVPNTSQWMTEAMNTPAPVRKNALSRDHSARPEPRRYSGFPDGIAVLRQIDSLYEAVGYLRGVPERTQSAPLQAASVETTLPPRVVSSCS